MSKQFQTLCLEKLVLKNVLVGLHEAKGDPPEKENEIKNRLSRFAIYKQFVWWIYQRLGRGNRRVLPSCILWKIREHYPRANGRYVLENEGEKNIRSLYYKAYITKLTLIKITVYLVLNP